MAFVSQVLSIGRILCRQFYDTVTKYRAVKVDIVHVNSNNSGVKVCVIGNVLKTMSY